MKKIERSGEKIVFDTSKIVEAVIKVAAEAIDLFAGIAEIISEAVEAIERDLSTALHSFAHWMMQCYYSAKTKINHFRCYNPILAIYAVFTIGACVKILILAAESVACKTRASYLLRTQDRGSSDSDHGSVLILLAT